MIVEMKVDLINKLYKAIEAKEGVGISTYSELIKSEYQYNSLNEKNIAPLLIKLESSNCIIKKGDAYFLTSEGKLRLEQKIYFTKDDFKK